MQLKIMTLLILKIEFRWIKYEHEDLISIINNIIYKAPIPSLPPSPLPKVVENYETILEQKVDEHETQPRSALLDSICNFKRGSLKKVTTKEWIVFEKLKQKKKQKKSQILLVK